MITDTIASEPTAARGDSEPATYRLRIWVWVFLGLLLVAGSIFQLFYWKNHQPEKKPRQPTARLPFVQTVPVVLADNQVQVEANGFVQAHISARLSSQISGKVIRVSPKLQVGKSVKQGETLVQLGISDYQAAVANAKANLASAQSLYAQEQGRARQAQRDAKRLSVKPTPLSLRKPQLAAAKAAVANAKAQLELAETNLARTTISAPFNAVIDNKDVALGERVSPGSALATLLGSDRFTVKLTIKAHDLPLIAVGDTLTLTDSTYGHTRHGVINRLSAGFNPQNRTVAAYVDIDQPLAGDTPLLLSDYVSARINGKRIANSAWIDNSAIVENRQIWRKNADDSINTVSVNVIYRGSKQSLVTFAEPVSTLISRPKDTFTNGQIVTTDASLPNPDATETDKSPQASRAP